MSLDRFSPAVREWFTSTFEAPTAAQAQGWPAIAGGRHTLILAPTGSGKTLAAFLWAIDRLMTEPPPAADRRCRVLYVSPLRALAVDVEKNLRAPLTGIGLAGERLGEHVHEPKVAIRTGDTSANERRRIQTRPPDILITTPESLYLMLTSQAREVLRSVRWVIVDEIHALAGTKRGAHLALSLERLEAIAHDPPQRIGLSATQRPLEEIARFLGGQTDDGPRPVTIVDAGHRKPMEVEVVVPVEDMTELSDLAETPQRMPAMDGPASPGTAPPRASIWPAIHPRLLELIQAHRSTIVFVNARRLAERLSARLNELAGEELALAHHGSISREQRLGIEDRLKRGTLKAIVATSSLELGIDMGAVDLVIQVESPGSVSRGLQRIGRSGHQVGEPSRGKIFPKYRGDLLESTVVVKRMLEGAIEETRYPRIPLDVLAQQIVAMCAIDEWQLEDLARVVRRAANYAELSDDLLHNVLDLLAGRYPSDEFAELRPRIVWDRRHDTIRAREGAGRIAIASGGTIPDRGLFGVFTVDGRRVGELDEEMVYESRRGEVFVLGATSWRIEDITLDRVVVSPAPGEPGKMPFWHGDRPGRPIELGRAIGAATRELAAEPHEVRISQLREDFGLDELAAENLASYLEDQRDATGVIPDDRTIVVERFPDELGDWRVCILSPFGARVHAPWAMAIEGRLGERHGLDVQVLWSDDGIAIRLPESEERIPVEDLLFDPDEVEELVVSRLPGTTLFTTTFRESAARALLLPRRTPGRRTPLWQQRQRGADLLEVASRHPTFPILLEATRECLRDVFDVPALKEVLGDVRARRIHVVPVDTARSSPFAQSLLFRWIAVYMYAYDAPMAERRAAALALDRDLLRELLGAEDLRELIDPGALADLELELQHLSGDRRARNADDVHDLLRRLGDLDTSEVAARSAADPSAWLDELGHTGRAIRVHVAGVERFIAIEDAGRFRDALGAALPLGVPAAFTESTSAPLEGLVARYARTHGPFDPRDVAGRFGVSEDRVAGALASLASKDRVVLGEFRPGGLHREWCDADVLRSIRRRSLAALRREVEPVDAATLGRFLPEWQAITRPRSGPTALVDTVEQLQGAAVHASILESDVLPSRVRGYRPADLDALCASGDVVWMGAGGIGADDGRIALGFREQLRLTAPPPPEQRPEGPLHDALREHLRAHGASFWPELLAAAAVSDERVVLGALWDLVWAGEVTNDTIAPLRAFLLRRPAKAARAGGKPRPGALRRAGPPSAAGRWSLAATLLEPLPSPIEAAHARAMQLLQRHGVLTREAVLAEGAPGGYAGVYGVLRALEESGHLRRGYFVDGLGAAQFALPGAVDRLRDLRPPDLESGLVALAAADPAQPYGAALPWPESAGRPARGAGAYVVLADGRAAAYLERGARAMLTFAAAAESAWVDGLASLVKDGRVRRIELSRIDGAPAATSPFADALREAGFVDGYRGLVLRG
ncbi:MAG: DEAD/DEAH box helicase [Actinobacteria bacterium]|nr:DEAD/DEAH box helicase [Actinomycetota bacterium]